LPNPKRKTPHRWQAIRGEGKTTPMALVHETIPHGNGVFAKWQPVYAQRGIATVPCSADKSPLVKHPERFGRDGSREIASKFPNAAAFGYYAGSRNGLTVLDCDSTDEHILADAMDRHGTTPLVIRTASGKYHALYRHNRERRRIRPWRGVPIDLLGGGLCIAAPSVVAKGRYQIVEGSLDDLDRLPIMRGLDAEFYSSNTGPRPQLREGDGRNNWLFRQLGREAHSCDDFDQLLDRGQTLNDGLREPMQEAEVAKIAGSIWKYTAEGRNRFGKHGAWFPVDEVERFRGEPDDFYLLGFLRAHHGPDNTFMVANGLSERFGWWRKRLAAARHRLIQDGYLKTVRQAGQNVLHCIAGARVG
jgi:Bifunctional DNA primase/polymerase, N-terminal/Primase C terminal 1 (PriCT-1)